MATDGDSLTTRGSVRQREAVSRCRDSVVLQCSMAFQSYFANTALAQKIIDPSLLFIPRRDMVTLSAS